MENYTGKITTTGTSKAIRLEKALFQSHPEFMQKAEVKAAVLGRGTLLISVIDDATTSRNEDDPVVDAFLNFMEKDMANSDKISEVGSASVDKATQLTDKVNYSDKDFE